MFAGKKAPSVIPKWTTTLGTWVSFGVSQKATQFKALWLKRPVGNHRVDCCFDNLLLVSHDSNNHHVLDPKGKSAPYLLVVDVTGGHPSHIKDGQKTIW